MLAVRDGDLAKLGVLFERYDVASFDLLRRMTGNPTAAGDLCLDLFVRIASNRATFRADGRFDTWRFLIARNSRAYSFRSRPPVAAIADEALEKPETAAGPAHQLEHGRELMRLK